MTRMTKGNRSMNDEEVDNAEATGLKKISVVIACAAILALHGEGE